MTCISYLYPSRKLLPAYGLQEGIGVALPRNLPYLCWYSSVLLLETLDLHFDLPYSDLYSIAYACAIQTFVKN